MSSVVDELTPQPGDPERSDADGEGAHEPATGFSAAFGEEIRDLLSVDKPRGLFGAPAAPAAPAGGTDAKTHEVAATPDTQVSVPVVDAVAPVVDETVAEAEPEVENEATAKDADTNEVKAQDADTKDADTGPPLFVAPTIRVPLAPETEKPAIGLFLPRVDEQTEQKAPALTGLALPPESAAPASAPNLFVSSEVAEAEVAFVAAEETEPNRYRWLIVLLGLLFIVAAIWLAWLAQSGETVDAPVTTVATVPTTVVSTTEAPPSTTASTTASTVPTTTATTVTTAAPTTAAAPQPTAPARPATTAAPVTAAPTTAAPTTAATVPDVTFAPPTWSPNTTAAAAEPPAEPAETTPPEPAPADPPAEG